MHKFIKEKHRAFRFIFAVFLILFQNSAPAFLLASPAFAQEKTPPIVSEVTLDFNANSHELILRGVTTAQTEYLLTYQAANSDSVQKAVRGSVGTKGEQFEEKLYIGSCSDQTCVPDDISQGTLVLPEAGYAATFQIANQVLWLNHDAVQTVAQVHTGTLYVAPQNAGVTLSFTALPENPGTLNIEEILLTEEQAQAIGAVSRIAYDITSTMNNGTFEYDLTLPLPDGNKHPVEMVYAESVAKLTDSETVESTSVPTESGSTTTSIIATKLNHFTVFALVQPQNMARNVSDVMSNTSSWFFYNDETDVINNTLGSFVTGPATPPYGTGSVQISVSGTQRRNLATYQFAGTPLASITELGFSTYNPSAGNGGSAQRSGYLNFNVDFNGSDTWQKRLVFVPPAGAVVQDSWQAWDAINSGNAVWLYSGATWPGTMDPGTTGKTWSQILSAYPVARVRVSDGWFGIRVGSPYADGYTENIDAVVFGTAAGTTVFNFEPLALTAPTNLGWNTRSSSATAGERPVDLTCGAVTNGDYPTYGNGMLAHNWSTSDTVPNLKYQRQWLAPGSGTWNTDGTIYSGTNTAFSTFGSAAGTEGIWNTRVRSWYDSNDNNTIDGSDPVSAWSNKCAVTYDRTAPAQPTGLKFWNAARDTQYQCDAYTQLKVVIPDWNDNTESDFDHYEYSSFHPSGAQGLNESILTVSELNNSWMPPADGAYGFAVRAVDVAGNKSAWSLSGESLAGSCRINYESAAPAVPIHISPADGTYTTSANLTKLDWSTVSDSNPISYFYQSSHSNTLNLDGSFSSPVYNSAALSASEIASGGTPDGVYYWHVRAQDSVGNTSAWSTPWKVTVDSVAPDVAITAPTGVNVSGSVPIRGTVTDANPHDYWLVIKNASNAIIAGPGTVNDSTSFTNKLFFNWDTTLVPEGTYTIYLEARDAANNKDAGSVATKTVVVDRTNPTSDLVFAGTGSSFTSFDVVFSEDVNQSEAENPSNYFLNNWPGAGGSDDLMGDANVTYNSATKTATVTFTTPGWYVSPEQEWGVQNIHDLAGNVLTTNPYTETSTPMVAPVTTDSGTDTSWHTSAVTVTLTCDDNTLSVGSGCKTTYYTTDGTDPTSTSSQGNSVIVSAEGETTIKYFSVDNAGNSETVKTAANTVKIDSTKPTSTITSYGLGNGGSVETATFTGLIEGTAADATSGVDHVLLSVSHLDFGADVSATQYWNATSSAWVNTESTFRATGTTAWNYQLTTVPEGIYTITSHAVDVAGIVETTYQIKVVYDKTIPQIVLTIIPTVGDGDNGWYVANKPTITLAASDNYSLDHIEYQWDSTSGTWSTYSTALTVPGEGQHILYYRSIDTVGNVSSIGIKEVKYDATKPHSQVQNVKVENITSTKADGSWTAPSNTDGIDYYELSWKHENGTERKATVSNSTFKHELTDLFDGLWTFAVRPKDLAGNYIETKIEFRVGPAPSTATGGANTPAVLGAATGVGVGRTPTSGVSTILGVSDTIEDGGTEANQESPATQEAGAVLGVTSCSPWQQYLPILLLVLQLLLLVGYEALRRDPLWIELLALGGSVLLVSAIFFIVRDMNCYAEGSWLGLVAQWFIALSIVLAAGVKLIAAAFKDPR